MNKKTVAAAAAFLVLAASVAFLNDLSHVQRAAIGGEVTWVVEPGARVEEGGALGMVAALSGGEAAAARAKNRGVVRETMATVGASLKKGDVVVFTNEIGGSADFVGIYVGGGKFISCNNPEQPTAYQNFNAGYWQERFVSARRVA